jgi:two-component system sensor histidine kinase/response regulator
VGSIRRKSTHLPSILKRPKTAFYIQIEAKNLRLESLHFSLPDEIQRSLALLGVRASDKGIEMTCHVDEKVPTMVVGDPHRLQQVLLNLAGNSLKFTHK